MEVLSVSEGKAKLHELARIVHSQHERFTLTRNGKPEAVLLSVDDLEGLEKTLEVLAHSNSVAAITEALAEIDAGISGTTTTDLRSEINPQAK